MKEVKWGWQNCVCAVLGLFTAKPENSNRRSSRHTMECGFDYNVYSIHNAVGDNKRLYDIDDKDGDDKRVEVWCTRKPLSK